MPSLHDPTLAKLFENDRQILAKTKLPIVTVTGTFREDLKKWSGIEHENFTTDVVFSRAHFSMAYGVLQSIWQDKIQQSKAWLVDPTNYVSTKQWRSISLTEDIGELLARSPMLKRIKDFIDQFGRGKLPILNSITPPLLYLFENTHTKILSFHIAAGNILLDSGKQVAQVVTDPHIRDEYLKHADNPKLTLYVFDQITKHDALEKAHLMGKAIDPARIIVTGPPVDQRIIQARKNKLKPKDRPLRLLLTTGGLGTNKAEIRIILEQLLPTYHTRQKPYEIMLYAGTEKDFVQMAQQLATEHKVKFTVISGPKNPDTKSIQTTHKNSNPLSIIYHPQIFDANELLIEHGFQWADGVVTKPSGDMAYDAVAAGCFLLTLKPWGVWEENIAEVFRQKGISRKAYPAQFKQQLESLQLETNNKSWISYAMKNAQQIDTLYLHGIENIIKEI